MPEVRIVVPKELDRALDAMVRAGFAGNKAELARTALIHLLSSLPTQMSRGYDLETAFSPDGRIFQLEYAAETTLRGGTIVGVCCPEGVVLAKRVRREHGRYPLVVTPDQFTRVFRIHESIGMVHCGLLMDGCIVVDEALKQVESLEKEGKVDIERLAKRLVLFIQSFGQRKDMRPLGTAILMGGIDSDKKPRLFLLGAQGIAKEHRATAWGSGRDEGRGILKEGYREDLNLEEATLLTVKAALRETKKPEVLVATIDAKTSEFKELKDREIEQILKKISS
jgi:proteasome alpha subunit